MTKEDFIKKYIYGIGNDALTDNQEAIDMAKDLDRYFAEQLRQYNVVEQSGQLKCGNSNPPCSPNIKFGCLECMECNWSEF